MNKYGASHTSKYGRSMAKYGFCRFKLRKLRSNFEVCKLLKMFKLRKLRKLRLRQQENGITKGKEIAMTTTTETTDERIERLYRLLALNRDIRTRNYPERDAELWTVQELIWEQAVSITKDLETTAKRIKRDADRACWLMEP